MQEIKAREDLDTAGKIEAFKALIVDLNMTDAQRAAAAKAAEEAKAKEVVVEDDKWSKEDIQNLTKAIVRFPPGTSQRWKVIAEYCGVRNQKEVIKKAQELATKRQNELEENRR